MIRNVMISVLAVVFFSCLEEDQLVKQTFTKSEIRRLLADGDSKSWQLNSNGSDSFIECEDDFLYLFRKNSSDTGIVYITEPLFDCEGNLVEERDTLETNFWTFTISTSELFDDELILIKDGEPVTYEVTGINPEFLEMKNLSEESVEVLRFEYSEEN
ncbi:MAG: hypothetical protein WBA74_26025 [Cyclobacteriaceae bacterium]